MVWLTLAALCTLHLLLLLFSMCTVHPIGLGRDDYVAVYALQHEQGKCKHQKKAQIQTAQAWSEGACGYVPMRQGQVPLCHP